jgi:hypothetical protein
MQEVFKIVGGTLTACVMVLTLVVAVLKTPGPGSTKAMPIAKDKAVIDEVVQIKAEPAAEPKIQEVVIDEGDEQKQKEFFADGFPEDTSSIKSLTAEEANSLVTVMDFIRKEKSIYLDGLTEINPEVAEKLALFKGRWHISLHGLDALDEDTARAFKNFKGYLNFEGLSSINQQTAKALTECDFEGVYLRVPTIDAASAKELSRLSRPALPTSEQLHLLVTYRNVYLKTLYLYLDTINKDVAKELKNIGCKLMLDVKGPIDATTLAYLKSNDRIIVFSESKVL